MPWLGSGLSQDGAVPVRAACQDSRAVLNPSEVDVGENPESVLARIAAQRQSGIDLIALLALSDDGHAACESAPASATVAINCPFPPARRASLPIRWLQDWSVRTSSNGRPQ